MEATNYQEKAGTESHFCKHDFPIYSLTDSINHVRVQMSGTKLNAAEQSSFPEGA